MTENREAIRAALAAFADGGLRARATALVESLGYKSERVGGDYDSPDDFIAALGGDADTKGAKALRDKGLEICLVSQITDDEIIESLPLDERRFDSERAQSFLFAAIELRPREYPRGELATMTREINKHFTMPVVVIFRCGQAATLAYAARRPSMRDSERDVLRRVSLLRGIDLQNPHRAHLDILGELSLPAQLRWIRDHHKQANFESLLEAWAQKLDIERLSREFYKELSTWFYWAHSVAVLPEHAGGDSESRRKWMIRLITRLLFCWFVKEKGLISAQTFNPDYLRGALRDGLAMNGDSYYKAILQNLFFATLNQEIDNRGFRTTPKTGMSPDMMAHGRWRYESLFVDPQAAGELFAGAPFLNGGLFECLDKREHGRGKIAERIDGFSDRKDNQLRLANDLFFGETREVDLREFLDDGAKKDVRGLIRILESYKFTLAENTPIERDVALDPELLGRVFENLLAAIDPDTGRTARKMSGSFYTRREIVEYMVDEALVVCLTERLGDAVAESDLRALFSRGESTIPFSSAQTDKIISAIDNLKIIDPAVGSGAFPMAVLDKLVIALEKLDPDNEKWKNRQIERARKIEDAAARQNAEEDIESRFQNNELGYGRKLFLIENCIFGVDNQPIACQIAKLRFFISLVIEQKSDSQKPNHGVTPLPNMETRIVAADALLPLREKNEAGLLSVAGIAQIQAHEASLRGIQRRIFTAQTLRQKDALRAEDKEMRQKIANVLVGEDLPAAKANLVKDWDPHDQMAAAADWFDPELMFGMADAFDIVIGNPPYVRQESIGQARKKRLLDIYRPGAKSTSDLYVYFYLRGLELLRAGGAQVFICSNSWLDVAYGAALQTHLLRYAHLRSVASSETTREFFTADINTVVTVVQKKEIAPDDKTDFVSYRASLAESETADKRVITRTRRQLDAPGFIPHKWGGLYLRAPQVFFDLFEQRRDKFVKIGDVAHVWRGITTGVNDFFYMKKEDVEMWDIEPEFLAPILASPTEMDNLIVRPNELSYVFHCGKDKSDLLGSQALEYIRYGESMGFHTKSTTRSRRLWYNLTGHKHACLHMNQLINDTMRFYVSAPPVLMSDNFYGLNVFGSFGLWQVAVAANSIISQMVANIYGRANYGGGLLGVKVFEAKEILIVKPELLDREKCEDAIRQMGRVSIDSPDRERLDDLVFDALKLPKADRSKIREETVSLIRNRLDKARCLARIGAGANASANARAL